ncbi:MAG TPA: hypothetical protein VGX23_10995 [Actinocrinis sp.]|nr:hypothetical protein [Actinocrinis sp.]
MELHEDSASFTPDQHPRGAAAKPGAFGPRRLWRGPAIGGSMALVAALCVYTGTAANASTAPATKVAAVSVQAAARPAVTTGLGGVHGAFNVYDGPGGGVEFWFNPSTGSLTVAVGAGAGVGASGVLGTYAPGTEPAAGTYLYASATLSAGTVVSENVSGTYSLNNGVFSGSVTATVDGRTVTLTSDGVSSFNASVLAGSGAAGWTANTGIKFVFNFDLSDVIDYIWNAITDFFTGQYSLTDSDYNYDTSVYDDSTGTDGSLISSDNGSTDSGSVSSDDGSSDSGDSGDDASSGDDGGGGGGGGGRSDDSTYPIEEESFSGALVSVHSFSK